MILNEIEKSAVQWLSNEIKQIPNFKTNNSSEVFTKKNNYSPPMCELVLFKYNAIYGNSFGYWDKFPIVLMVRPLEDHFFGFNLHYIEVEQRQKIIDLVYKLNSISIGDKSSAVMRIYPFLNALVKTGLYNSAYKNYNYSNMESNFVIVHPDHYSLVSKLPIARLKENNK